MIRQIPLFVSLTTAAAVLSLSGCSMSGPGGGAAQTVVATPTPEPIPTLPPSARPAATQIRSVATRHHRNGTQDCFSEMVSAMKS